MAIPIKIKAIGFKVTEEQKREIDEAAEKVNKKTADFAREEVLKKAIKINKKADNGNSKRNERSNSIL